MGVLVKGAGVPKDTRNRMLDAAVSALRRQGVAGMSFTEVLGASGAARGAIYHHFPGGKTQLVAEAAARNGQEVRGYLEGLPATGPVQVTEDFLAMIRPVVAESSAGSGCAVAAVAMGDEPALREASATALSSWIGTLAGRLSAAGLPAADADDLATTLIALLEGAHVLCRAAGDVAPFDRAARAALSLVGSRYPADDG
ncbi:TetR/AcrR family transcriptional regulator [Actinoplanes subtropicus]|uniref:TetR/AcrR family transcriptional regulator n=1 Tax=Actinoplanes subtropicus TaxID=543632 RepID=UPI0006923293|nr:TetR/AcrR family transcriptional regulator [Actinoplanes subtropicus]